MPTQPEASHVLYTYANVADPAADGGVRVDCHVCGPTSEAQAQLTGTNLQQSAATVGESLSFMVLPLEPMPV